MMLIGNTGDATLEKKLSENENKQSIESNPTIDLNRRYVLDYELVEKN